MTEEQERWILLAAKAGDPEAVTCLYERTAERIARLLQSKMDRVSPEDIEDAIQHVFVKFLQEPLAVRADSINGFVNWGVKVGRNHLLDELKSPRRKHTFTTGALVGSGGDEGEQLGWVPHASGLDLTESVARVDVFATLHRAIEQLDPESRRIVELTWFQGVPSSHVRQEMGLTVDQLKKRRVRALQGLREILAREGITVDDLPP
ncbi:MAG: RNA polymerase sigma factor [Bacillota bacterium]